MKRQIQQTIDKLLTQFPCVVLLGARQVGKSTVMKQIAARDKKWQFYDLERRADFSTISLDPDLFFKKNPDHIIIDEAQLMPSLFNALRVAIDDNRQVTGRFLLTGSSSPSLLEAISETLAGRVAILNMNPLSFSEIGQQEQPTLLDFFSPECDVDKAVKRINETNTAKEVTNDSYKQLDRFFFQGGYPEPWLLDSPDFNDTWFEQYNKTYIERDIAQLFPRLNQTRFRRFMDVLAQYSGEILNYTNMASLLDVSQSTIKDYLRIAEGTFIWRTLPAYDKNAKKRVIKHPKGHFRDSGLLHHLLMLPSSRQLQAHPKMGHSWEALVIEEIIKTLDNFSIPYRAYHYRTSAGAEVDLILEGKFGLIPVEIKYGQTIKQRQIRPIKDFIEEFQCPFGLVINNDARISYYADNIIGLPMTMLANGNH